MSNATSYQFLKYDVADGIVWITLNRPEVLNACHSALHKEIQQAIDDAENDARVHVVLLRGAGRAFCSGSDLREVGAFKGEASRHYIRLDFATKNRVAGCLKPVVAVLHGHVAGGGFELALACDIRIAADNTLFSLPEIQLGTIAGSGGLQRLPQIVGLGIAKEWAFTGRRIDAAEALRTGLVNHVYALDVLEAEARKFARVLTQRSAVALGLTKRALDPVQPSQDGMVGMYHMLASQVCHDGSDYGTNTTSYVSKPKTE